MPRLIKVYDTTLRDGTQGEGVAFSMEDKIRIAQRLDALGVHYIEGGWPGSNPKDLRFFRRIHGAGFNLTNITAFDAPPRGPPAPPRAGPGGRPNPPAGGGARPAGRPHLGEILGFPRHVRDRHH